MSIHLYLNLYWLLLPLALVLLWWTFHKREDERGGYLPGLGLLFRVPVAAVLFVLVLCGLLASNLWLK
jgi:hypothetical protein